MNRLRLLRAETARLFRSPAAWLLAGLTALSPLAGYRFWQPALGDSMASLYLANPMTVGGLCGTLFFALLTLLCLDHPRRSGASALAEAAVSPAAMQTVRLLSVLLAALLTGLLVCIAYLPYTAWKLDIVFSLSDYLSASALLFLSGPVMGALAASLIYQVTYRPDVSMLAVAAFLAASRSHWCAQYFLMQWSVPLAPALSDAFGSALVWRTALYSRMVWLLLLGGGWLVSLLCVRRYGYGLRRSFLRRARRPAPLLAAAVLFAAGGWLWQAQPFMDHSPADWMSYEEPEREYQEALLLEETRLHVSVDSYLLGTLSGTAVYQLRNSSGQPQELYLELNPGYSIRTLSANGVSIPFEDLGADYIASRELRCTLPADPEILLEVTYGGMPRIWNAQEAQLSGSFLSARGLELSSMHLAPVLAGSVPVAETAPVTLRIRLKDSLTPVSSGSTELLQDNGDGTRDWLLTDTGTDRFRLFAGDYESVTLEGGGMPIEFYYSSKYKPRLESMDAVDMMEQVIAYCTAHYGPRSFTDDKPFKIIQTTVFDFGGFASGNLSGMGEVYFSDVNLRDPDKGAASAEVLAHEIVHQWWGLGASLLDPEQEYWTDEGITTYTTYRILRTLRGEEYAQRNYRDKWADAVQASSRSFYVRHPEYLDRLPERYRGEISASIQSVNLYDGTALMIDRAAQLLGEAQLDAIWSALYREGGTEMPPYITLGDFLNACGLTEEELYG